MFIPDITQEFFTMNFNLWKKCVMSFFNQKEKWWMVEFDLMNLNFKINDIVKN